MESLPSPIPLIETLSIAWSRLVIGRALVEHDLLRIRRRRMPLPKCASSRPVFRRKTGTPQAHDDLGSQTGLRAHGILHTPLVRPVLFGVATCSTHSSQVWNPANRSL